MTDRTPCSRCGEPLATAADIGTIPEGETGGLCWHAITGYKCEMRDWPEELRDQKNRLIIVLQWCVMEQHQGAYRDVGQWLRLALWALENGKRVPVPPFPFGGPGIEADPDCVVSAYLAEHSWEQPPDTEHPAAAQIQRLREAIDRDRTGLAAALAEVQRTAEGYSWIPDGQWGSYEEQERTVETLRAEVGSCIQNIMETTKAALRYSGNLAQRTLFPDRYPDAVQPLSDAEREELGFLRDRSRGLHIVAKREAELRIRADVALEEIAGLTGLAPGSSPAAVAADVRRVLATSAAVEPVSDADVIDALIARSSLGTPEVEAIRSRCPPGVVEEVNRRIAAMELEEREACPSCDGEAVSADDIAAHESVCSYESHDILDDGGGKCTTCGAVLDACSVCGPYHGRKHPESESVGG